MNHYPAHPQPTKTGMTTTEKAILWIGGGIAGLAVFTIIAFAVMIVTLPSPDNSTPVAATEDAEEAEPVENGREEATEEDGEATQEEAESAIHQDDEEESEEEPPEAEETPQEGADESSETSGQSNARQSAESYLNAMAFSREGLISQLEYEGYSTEDATYAVDAVDADWYEQAVKKAESYLDTMSFSYEGLVSQLEYEGFTSEQAHHGAGEAY